MCWTDPFPFMSINQLCCGNGAIELVYCMVNAEPQNPVGSVDGATCSQPVSLHLRLPPTSPVRSTQSQGPGISPSTRPDNRSMGPVLY